MQKPNQLLILNLTITETETNEHRLINLMTTFGFKQRTRFGTWNVRSLLDPAKLSQLCKEMENYKLLFMGLSETRWPESAEFRTRDGLTLIYSGKPSNQPRSSGVGFLLSKDARNALIDWKPHSDRIITARFRTRARNITCVQCYAPTEASDLVQKEDFYSNLSRVTSSIHRGDIVILLGDFNAQLGPDNANMENIMGRHALGRMTENGQLFAEMCISNNLVIGGTLFPHKKVHKVTWVSPDQTTQNQIDHIAISKTWRNCLLDVRNMRGADCSSDHHLIVGTIKLKVAAIKKTNRLGRRFDTRKLNTPQYYRAYVNDIQSSLDAVQSRTNVDWPTIKSCFTNAAKDTIGYRSTERKEWISDQTWDLISKRRTCKASLNNAKTRNEKRRLQATYTSIDKDVKKSARRDKRRWVDDLAKEAQTASESHRSKDLYRITKQLGRKSFTSSKPLKNSNGEIITSKTEQVNIWVDHYEKLLNTAQTPSEPTCLCLQHRERDDVPTEKPGTSEIETAIRTLKNNKAPGIDNISPELLKADPATSAQLIYPLIEKFWETYHLSDDLKEGIIIKIPKKGDLTECKNWRGITLLSMVNKVIANIINKRLLDALYNDIRKEQAGFRPSKSCIDHINSLRIITEQSVEWRSPLYLTFIDFEKAFDTVHHSAIWRALRCKGIPERLIRTIQALYDNAKCRILHEDVISCPINVNVGVRQGCPLSPLLFNVVVDSIMAKVTLAPRGITWRLNGRLEDLDYADDICLLAHRYDDMQLKLKCIETEAAFCGLRINIPKTKAMRLNTTNSRQFMLQGQQIEDVQSFCYLGSIITTSGGSREDVANRINKARQAYGQLNHVWKSCHISKRTKVNIFNNCVKAVALYGCESWNSNKCDINALQVFINRCLRRIQKIFWPNTISNERLWNETAQSPVESEIRMRKWRWIGHAMRRPQDDITRNAIEWNPQGSRRKGRPSHTWRRQLDTESTKINKTWNELKNVAADKQEWNSIVKALCSL